MSWFFDAVPYILAGGTILLGAFEIVKDWKEYKTSWLRMAVSVVFIVVAALSIAALRHDNQLKRTAELKADSDMKALQSKADAAGQAQADNTKMYVESFTKMSGQISDLNAEVKTEALQKKLAAVQAELLKTQKAMAPGPKAELAFTFMPFDILSSPQKPILRRDVTLQLQSDGSIHTEFRIVNPTSTDAVDVALNLHICDGCKFAKEPITFSSLTGMQDWVRFAHIPDLHALEVTNTINLDIIPPAGASQIPVGLSYRCSTCVVQPGASPAMTGIIHIKSP
jgi:hypothetical protein